MAKTTGRAGERKSQKHHRGFFPSPFPDGCPLGPRFGFAGACTGLPTHGDPARFLERFALAACPPASASWRVDGTGSRTVRLRRRCGSMRGCSRSTQRASKRSSCVASFAPKRAGTVRRSETLTGPSSSCHGARWPSTVEPSPNTASVTWTARLPTTTGSWPWNLSVPTRSHSDAGGGQQVDGSRVRSFTSRPSSSVRSTRPAEAFGAELACGADRSMAGWAEAARGPPRRRRSGSGSIVLSRGGRERPARWQDDPPSWRAEFCR